MQQELQFKISSALKNIIGSDLINDDFIAVFELVKNSYDAHATQVEVIFENIHPKIIVKDGIEVVENNAKIIIKDNGKGMNYDDLINKWLFVAYSAKKEGTEEDSYDYRDKIKVKRAYAGAKGIGRFSCDRLGQNLYLETIKDEENTKVEVLVTDWGKFEGDIKEEFINISVLHDTIDKSNYNVKHGTVLEITNLKSDWNRNKFIDLKNSLSRLINPISLNEEDKFNIIFSVIEEEENDKLQVKENNKRVENQRLDKKYIHHFRVVNGDVINQIFDILNLKTSFINSKIESTTITTSLFEAGKLVYKIVEKNIFKNLENIDYSMFFLNPSAKSTFTRRMGIEPVNYGHIFIYKNGLRIFPYGERGEDPLKMDNRKAQGYNRYLGTRDVIGFISITGENHNLRETSSRGDGLIKTSSYFELEHWFYETLKRLETYNLEITDWGTFLSDNDFINLNQILVKNQGEKNEKVLNINENLEKFVKSISKSKDLISFEVSEEILKIIEKKSEGSVKTILGEIKEKIEAEIFDKKGVIETIKNVEKRIEDLKKVKEEAENEAFQKLIENERLEKELKEEITKRLFDNSIVSRDKEDLLTLQHQIVHTAKTITFSLDELMKSVNDGVTKEKLIEEILSINLEVKKILSASRFVTNAGFNLEGEKIKADIVQFSYEYIQNNYIPINSYIHQKRAINIFFKQPQNIRKELKFRPLEITVLLDNLFNNSKIANAKNIEIEWFKLNNELILSFKDDGIGVPEEIKSKIFNFGFTTTTGSGMGLVQAKNILEGLGAKIDINTNFEKGVAFLLKFPL